MPNYDAIVGQLQDDPTTAPQSAAQPAQPASPYDKAADALLSQDQTARAQAALALSFSSDSNPDQAAANAQLAKRYNTTPDVVAKFPQEFRQRVMMETMRDTLAKSPTLQTTLNQNPATAQIIHDDVPNAAGIEQAASAPRPSPIASAVGDLINQTTRSFGSAVAPAFKDVALAASTPFLALDAAAGTSTANLPFSVAQWFDDYAKRYPTDKNAGFLGRVAQTLGSTLGLVSEAMSTGGEAAVQKTGATVAEAVGAHVGHGIQAMLVPSTVAAQGTAQQVLDNGGDLGDATKAGLASYVTNTAGGVVPFATPGNLMTRLFSGALASTVLSENSRNLMNAALPKAMQQPEPTAEDRIMDALTGAVFGGLAGPHTAARDLVKGVSQSHAAEQDFNTLSTLSQMAAASKWRERDPESFKAFVNNAAENGPVDRVYVDGNAFMQSMDKAGVTLDELRQKVPDLANQLNEAVQTGGDVSMPLGDYATHIAGSKMDADLLPLLKTDPEGKTYAEAQQFYQDQAETMKSVATQLASQTQESSAFKASQDTVHQAIQQQLDATGRFPTPVTKIYAGIQSAILSRIAAHEGITPEQAFEKYGANTTAEGLGDTGKLDQLANNGSGESPASLEAQSRLASELDKGQARVKVDKYGNVTPLATVDGVDARAYPGEHILQKGVGAKEWTVLDAGEGSTPGAVARATAAAKQSADRSGKFLQDVDQRTIQVDGARRPITNSEGRLISGGFNEQKAFWKWFGDSKVANEEGKPLVVYHGSPDARFVNEDGVFSTMKDRMLRYGSTPESRKAADDERGFFFTTAHEVARSYADPKRAFDYQNAEPGVVSSYLAVSNPLEFDANGLHWREAQTQISKENFIKTAKNAGHDGVVIRNVRDNYDSLTSGNDPLSDVWIAFHPEQIKSATGNSGKFDPNSPNILEQSARGFYSPDSRTIGLLENADLSTYLHETGHWALDTYARIAGSDNASPAIREEMGRILKWFGVDSVEKWNGMTLDEQRPYHEEFARAFEAYLFEGKAPSLELQGAFARIRSWMVNIYRSMRSLNVDLTPEVRGVFDRMLASDDAIREAETARGFVPVLTEKPAGVSDDQWSAYLRLGSEATDDALTTLQAKSLKNMKWTRSAHSKALRALQREAAGIRRETRAQVEKDVDQMPVYRAERWITKGELLDDKGDVNVKLDDAAKKGAKINTAALKEMYPDTALNKPDVTRLKGLTGPDGMHPDTLAEMLGFSSGDDLVRSLADREPRASVVDGLTEKRMLEEHGEVATPDALAAAADAAIHNDSRARQMAAGLEILLGVKGGTRRLERDARLAADAAIAAKRVGDVNPRQYLAAETRANRAAIKAAPKDPVGAAKSQREALLNNALVRAAQQAVDDTRAAIAYAKSFDKRAKRLKIDPDERDLIDHLLSRFDFSPTLFREFDGQGVTRSEYRKQTQLSEWVASQKALGYAPKEVADMLNPDVRMHYKDMTVEQLRGLMDTIHSIEKIGRERKTVTVDGKRMDTAQAILPMLDLMKQRGEKFTDAQLAERPRYKVDPLWRVTLDRMQSGMRTLASELIRPDYKANKYDLHNLLGPFQKAVAERLFSAAYRYGDYMDSLAALKKERMAEHGLDKPWQDSLNEVVANHNLLDNSLDTPAKRRLTRGDLIGIAMHVGNESNFDKLTRGMGWQPEEIWQTLHDNMREKDWRAAQLLGEMAGARWDEMSAMNRNLGNDTPDKIEPRPFPTKYGEMPGWYAPVRYDPIRSKLAESKRQDKAVNWAAGLFGKDYYRADTTTNGSLNARKAGYYDFIDLDWRPIEKAITDTMRDLSYREALIDAHKIITHPEFRKQFQRTYGPEEYNHLGQWLGNLANQEISDASTSKWIAISAASRRAMVANGVAFRISTMLKHGGSAGFKSTGYFAGGGEKYFAQRVAAMATNHGDQVTEALAKFPEIRNRLRQQDRDYALAAKSIFEPESIHGKAERFGHAAVAYLDFLSAVPTAHAAYDWAITTGIPKRLGGTGKPMSEADAIMFANKTVREAHGSTNEASRSLLLNSRNELVRILTTLNGFMNNALGQTTDALDKSLHANGFGKPELLARVMMGQIVPAILAGYISFGGPNKDQSWLGWAFHHIGGEFAGMVPMVRDGWSATVDGFNSAGAMPVIRAMLDVHKAGKAIAQGKDAKHPIKDVGNAAGLLLPGLGQIGSTTQFLYDEHTGQQRAQTVGEWIHGVMTGNSAAHK